MKSASAILLTLSLLVCAHARAQDPAAADWSDTVNGTDGSAYKVQVSQKKKKVEVVRESGAPGELPNLRLRLMRKNDRPFELKLKLVEQKNDLPRYSSEAAQWQGSVVGFQLEFSFDKKTWKRIGNTINRSLP